MQEHKLVISAMSEVLTHRVHGHKKTAVFLPLSNSSSVTTVPGRAESVALSLKQNH